MLRIIVEIVFVLLLMMAVPLLRLAKMCLFGHLKLKKYGSPRGCSNGQSGPCTHDCLPIKPEHNTYLIYPIILYIKIKKNK